MPDMPGKLNRISRLQAPAQEPPTQPAELRIRNFDEVFLPWTESRIRAEAARCLHCPDAPCVGACPLGADLPEVMGRVEAGDFRGAGRVVRARNNLAEICCRICPQLATCQHGCPHHQVGGAPVAIGHVVTFVADISAGEVESEGPRSPSTGRRVAVVGAGAAGITVAELLAGEGHLVTVFDQWPQGGGSLRYRVPRFRLDHTRVQKCLDHIHEMGVAFVFDTRIGGEKTVDDLLSDGFEAVFLGTGAGNPEPLDIPGARLEGVLQADPFLVRANVEQNFRPSTLEDPPTLGPRVVVVGSGDTATDCCRTAIRLGALEVSCHCSEKESEALGDPANRAMALAEGVTFDWGWTPEEMWGDRRGRVRGVRFRRARRSPGGAAAHGAGWEKPDVERDVPAESVILVAECKPDPRLAQEAPGLQTGESGLLLVDQDTGRTSREGVWAGGGNVVGCGLVAEAVAQGRVAARNIHASLMA